MVIEFSKEDIFSDELHAMMQRLCDICAVVPLFQQSESKQTLQFDLFPKLMVWNWRDESFNCRLLANEPKWDLKQFLTFVRKAKLSELNKGEVPVLTIT